MHELAIVPDQHQNPQHSRTLVQDVLETWRLRTPNDWDPIPWHNQVLSWRGFMHDMIAGAQKSIQEVHPNIASQATGHSLDQLGMRDRAWAVNRFARIARKHNLPEVALSILSTQRPHVEVQEAFVKLSEQSRAYLDIEGEAVWIECFDSTSLEYFAPHHQAKLFHLRGQFQERLGEADGSRKLNHVGF